MYRRVVMVREFCSTVRAKLTKCVKIVARDVSTEGSIIFGIELKFY